MKHIDEYRSHELCARLLEKIKRSVSRPWCIMEVCGGQTHAILRHGIDDALEGYVKLIHGPGCPVCVTPVSAIDLIVELALQPNVVIASFGDMLRVPGTRESLMHAKSQGANVKIVYSPLDILKLAQMQPEKEIVFFAVGFETTAPATALMVQQASALSLENVSMLTSHVRVLPAMEFIAQGSDSQVDGFLGAGHACTITGYGDYHNFAKHHNVPVAVTGFEPVDILRGILACVAMLERGKNEVVNVYERSVNPQGNPFAIACINEVYETVDSVWRGLGLMPHGGFSLRKEFKKFCSKQRFSLPILIESSSQECRSGDVMTGVIRPTECPHFSVGCTPDKPMGAPMISNEGACNAYYRYRFNQE